MANPNLPTDVPPCTATGPLTPDGLPWPLDERWRTETVIGLALGIREDHAFARLPILADALEETGCDDELVLLHCRECRHHDPDCWVVAFCLEGDPLERPDAVAERMERYRQLSIAWEAAKARDWEPPPSPVAKWLVRVTLRSALFLALVLLTRECARRLWEKP